MPETLPQPAASMVRDLGFALNDVRSLKGDLSSRRYYRVAGAGGSAILMVVPPGDRDIIERVVDRTSRLEAAGLSVPAIFAASAPEGLAVVEDFGDVHLADMLRGGQPSEPLLGSVIDALSRVRLADIADLPSPDAAGFVGWLDILDDWLPGADTKALSELRRALVSDLKPVMKAQPFFSLRDAHAENVIWLSDREGAHKAGLIDFQDAFAIHPMYDVASLLRDARIDIPEDVVSTLLGRAASDIGLDLEEARLAFDLLTIQRNLRIAAIFHRSASLDGKSAHLDHLPRVYGHIRRAAENPLLAHLKGILRHSLPDRDADR